MFTLLTALRLFVRMEFRTSIKVRRNYDSTHSLFLCALKWYFHPELPRDMDVKSVWSSS